MDLLARDTENHLVVIELKAGKAKDRKSLTLYVSGLDAAVVLFFRLLSAGSPPQPSFGQSPSLVELVAPQVFGIFFLGLADKLGTKQKTSSRGMSLFIGGLLSRK